MLHEFLRANRAELMERCISRAARRSAPKAAGAGLEHGLPMFVEQLIETLRAEHASGPAGGGSPGLPQIGEAAARHGRELLQHGFTVDQVVHRYGDLCQAITELADERGAPLRTGELRTLARCLDIAIADAVTEFAYQRDLMIEDKGAHAMNERLGFLAHELRDLLNTATLAMAAIKSGNVGLAGATGAVLDRSLIGLRSLIDRSLTEVRVSAGMPVQRQLLSLAEFIAEVRLSGSLEAQARGCRFTVSVVDPKLAVSADRHLLFSAVGNLLQNAFKFTEQNTEVFLNAYAAADRILIDVEDNCGGLPPGEAQSLFLPFTQGHADRGGGLGLGLSISRRSVEANGGVLRVRDVPGSGCVFTIDLPRQFLPEPAIHSSSYTM
jgi:hypothetical protein